MCVCVFFNELFISFLCPSADRRDTKRRLVWLCAEMPLSKCHNTATASSEHLTLHLLSLCVCVCLCETHQTKHDWCCKTIRVFVLLCVFVFVSAGV